MDKPDEIMSLMDEMFDMPALKRRLKAEAEAARKNAGTFIDPVKLGLTPDDRTLPGSGYESICMRARLRDSLTHAQLAELAVDMTYLLRIYERGLQARGVKATYAASLEQDVIAECERREAIAEEERNRPDSEANAQPIPPPAPAPEPSINYAIQAFDGGPIKLGKGTGNGEDRLRSLQIGHPKTLRLLGVWPGGIADEAAMHEKWEHLRIRGEWFADNTSLRRWVAMMVERGCSQ